MSRSTNFIVISWKIEYVLPIFLMYHRGIGRVHLLFFPVTQV